MAAKRTKQEIINFLNKQVGQSVNSKCGKLRGQCVSLNKALFEFLGVPNPYAGRGNAKDVGNNYVAQNIAEKGSGWLNIAVNRKMGGGYGHTWTVIKKNEANYEQNGAKALRTTKNTRPISQAQQIVNLDKWIKPDAPKPKPATKKYYIVRKGDTVDGISGKYHLDKRNNYQGFRRLNPGVKNVNNIFVGQKVRVK